MRTASSFSAVLVAALLAGPDFALADPPDPRVREIQYDPGAVVTIPVKRGIVTHILLDADETITDVASGLGSDCTKPDATWCVSAQAGGRSVFVKPKSTATASNNLAVVTDKRTHTFRFVLLSNGDDAVPVYRLAVHAPVVRKVASAPPTPGAPSLTAPPRISPKEVVAERLKAAPEVLNSDYSIAEGAASEDIVPTLVFDDGRFTYFRFPGNRQIPAVFDVLGDGSETIVNTRMEGDVLVVDRVSRRLMLRAGSAVVGVWNEDFDLQGRPPAAGATVPGVQRLLRSEQDSSNVLQARSGATR